MVRLLQRYICKQSFQYHEVCIFDFVREFRDEADLLKHIKPLSPFAFSAIYAAESLLLWGFTLVAVACAIAIYALTAQSSEQTSALSSSVSKMVCAPLEQDTGNESKIAEAAVSTELLIGFGADGLVIVPLHMTFGVRKLAHTVEFLALGVSVGLATRMWVRHLDGRHTTVQPRVALVSLTICAAYSLFDQAHKLFVPGREFDFIDLPFDAVGYLAGIGIALLGFRIALRGPLSSSRL